MLDCNDNPLIYNFKNTFGNVRNHIKSIKLIFLLILYCHKIFSSRHYINI
jgi:hypothetical protein